jgi:uncharacterized protein (DUF362 family)
MNASDAETCTLADEASPPATIDRRTLLVGAGLTAAAVAGLAAVRRLTLPTAAVFLARGQRYDGPIEQTIRDGLLACGLTPQQLAGRRVLLKPNLVEPSRAAPHITTHPALVAAAAHVFQGWGAEVTVGEAPGHVRDSELVLAESGMDAALDDARLEFADLNYQDVRWLPNRGGNSALDGFYFPRSVVEADLIVSMPKLKTHHWVGMTAALKNMYGVLPGIKYGWPKNVLHHAGIPQTVCDINASLPPTIAIVDGIVAMQGDGPIMGGAKPLGLIAVGTNATAVDATCARVMGLAPERISYLRLAADRLGPIAERRIAERGEHWRDLLTPFEILDQPHLRGLRAS